MALPRRYLQWLFVMEICRGYLPLEFAATICRGNLPQLFAEVICHKNLSWLFVVGLYCVFKQTFFLCEQIFFLCKQSFFNWKQTLKAKLFFICESFLINNVSFFVTAVVVMGHAKFRVQNILVNFYKAQKQPPEMF